MFAPELVRYVVAPEASSAAQQITVDCMRILLLSPVFLGFGIAAKGILEGQDLFTLPALAPIVYNAATILGAILLGPRVGVYGVAIGVVGGAIGFLLLQIPGLVRSGMRYSFSFDPADSRRHEVGRLLAPRLIGQAAFQLNFIAVTNLAWRTGEQSVSALNYAWQLLMLPHGVLALSVSTVILPTLSRLWQVGDTAAFRATLGNALRPLLFLSASGGGDSVRVSPANCPDPLPDGCVLRRIDDVLSRRRWHSWPLVSSAMRWLRRLRGRSTPCTTPGHPSLPESRSWR